MSVKITWLSNQPNVKVLMMLSFELFVPRAPAEKKEWVEKRINVGHVE
jgi:hypothetical protein